MHGMDFEHLIGRSRQHQQRTLTRLDRRCILAEEGEQSLGRIGRIGRKPASATWMTM